MAQTLSFSHLYIYIYIYMGESTGKGKGFRVFPLSLLIYTTQNSLQYKRQACGFLSALFGVFTRQLCFSMTGVEMLKDNTNELIS